MALLGGILGKRTTEVGKEGREEVAERCSYDGTRLNPVYQVDALLDDGSTRSFCSIYCATRWFEGNKDKVIYLTVVDEMTGEKFDSTLGHFVESDVITVREVKNRIHAFANREDALKHAQQFNGKLVDNPFGRSFVLPKVARFDKLTIGTPSLPDSIPVKSAIFRPIFKENRLDVHIVSFQGDNEGRRLLSEPSVAGVICDLPTGLLLAKGNPPARIVKNMLRANPYRPLYGLVGASGVQFQDFIRMEAEHIALPKGLSFLFYAEYYLKSLDIPLDKVVIKEVDDVAEAWHLLNRGEVSAALLRTPYTDMAMAKGLAFLADDRNLPWMSVMVLKHSLIENKFEVVKRFIFGMEQSVLALNLKPDEFSALLQEQGGIPKDYRKDFPMPIFEGANAPAPEEIEIILAWLVEKGLLERGTTYQELINTQFLPNPEDVGLAFCCR